MTRVYCIGELLIDFISTNQGVTLENALTFEKKAGGAPANVAVATKRVGGDAYFLGQVGDDAFGRFLIETLQAQEVNTNYLEQSGKTTLAFVSLAEDGERSFEFFRGSDGEYVLQPEIERQLGNNDIVHFGSATGLLDGKLKESYFQLLTYAMNNQSFISFDPNYRDLLVTDRETFIADCFQFMEVAHLIKLSDEEAMMLTNTLTLEDALGVLQYKTKGIITITLGAQGTLIFQNGKQTIIPSIKIAAVDTTGAGDCFIGTLLGKIATLHNVHDFSLGKQRDTFVQYANVAAALTCTKYGAIAALPYKKEIETIIDEVIQ